MPDSAEINADFRFEDMKLRIGSKMQLELTYGGTTHRHYTSLIGYLPGEYLIVKTPLQQGVSVAFQEDDDVAVRLVSGVHAFAFTVKVQRVFLAPIFYLHLAFPQYVHGTVVRQAVRARMSLPAKVTNAALPEPGPHQANIANLSSSGALVEAPIELGAKGQSIRLEFVVPGVLGQRSVTVKVDATIQNVTPPARSATAETRVYGYGVKFAELSDDGLALLQNLVYRTLAESGTD